jgi:hypothetical protein
LLTRHDRCRAWHLLADRVPANLPFAVAVSFASNPQGSTTQAGLVLSSVACDHPRPPMSQRNSKDSGPAQNRYKHCRLRRERSKASRFKRGKTRQSCRCSAA